MLHVCMYVCVYVETRFVACMLIRGVLRVCMHACMHVCMYVETRCVVCVLHTECFPVLCIF